MNKGENSERDHHPLPLRLSRAVSPGVKAALGTGLKHPSIPSTSHSTAYEPTHDLAIAQQTANLPNGIRTSPKVTGMGTGQKPSNLVLPDPSVGESPHVSPTGPLRRTAGSSILTSTSYDRPFAQRRVPYRPANLPPSESERQQQQQEAGEEEEKGDIEVEAGVNERADEREGESANKITNGDHQFSPNNTAPPQSGVPVSPKISPPQPGPEPGSAPPGRSKTSPLIGSKLQAPANTSAREGKADVFSDAAKSSTGTVGSTPAETERPSSRLKKPASGLVAPTGGRSTPTDSLATGGGAKSSLAQPSSRLPKPLSQAAARGQVGKAAVGTATTKEGGEGDAGGSRSKADSSDEAGVKSALKRVGSDGKRKQYGIISSGKSSLPRNLPKGVLATSGILGPGHQPKMTSKVAAATNDSSAHSSDELLIEGSGSSRGEKTGSGGGGGGQGGNTESQTSPTLLSTPKRSLKKPAKGKGAVKAGSDREPPSSVPEGRARTPNLPSGPSSATTAASSDNRTSSGEKADSVLSSSRLPSPSLKRGLTPTSGIRAPAFQAQRDHQPTLGAKVGGATRASPKTAPSSSDAGNPPESARDGSHSGDAKPAISPPAESHGNSEETAPLQNSSLQAAKGSMPARSAHLPPLQLAEGGAQGEKGDEILTPPAAFRSRSLVSKNSSPPSTAESSTSLVCLW